MNTLLERERIGYTIQMAREAKGMSREELAQRVGSTRQYIAKLEKATYNTNIGLYLSVCKELGLSLTIN